MQKVSSKQGDLSQRDLRVERKTSKCLYPVASLEGRGGGLARGEKAKGRRARMSFTNIKFISETLNFNINISKIFVWEFFFKNNVNFIICHLVRSTLTFISSRFAGKSQWNEWASVLNYTSAMFLILWNCSTQFFQTKTNKNLFAIKNVPNKINESGHVLAIKKLDFSYLIKEFSDRKARKVKFC